MKPLTINFARMKETIEYSAKVGEIPNNGLCRLALSKEDKAMREQFQEWMIEAGLEVRVDDFGNMYGRRKGQTNLDPLVVGSHLDTQPNGGRFDGVLGVLSALEAIRTLNDYEIETYRSIEIVNFANEEGARFEPPLLGSGGLAGVFSKEYVYNRQDRDRKVFKNELAEIGFKSDEKNRLQRAHAFLELHIEQGPILENERITIGAVEGIKGMSWLEVKVTGEGGHAGPTPMPLRKDAMMAATSMIAHIERKCADADGDLTVTVGRLDVKPGAVNCIPEKVVFSVDVRHLDDEIREKFIAEEKAVLHEMAADRKVDLETEMLWEVDTSTFHEDIIFQVSKSAERLGYSNRRLYSGAGHDAKYMNDFTATGMIFLSSVDGKSHVESELTLDDDIYKGANVLLDAMIHLADNKE
ncbi:Zn-dependent hydrolase [Virgibacillus ihumii]|uniref:Zn-dependent hydrolase n=1 Tax=Virgibacillus ihumii TaxID=2686091 RepID=UPI00157C140C|nr:Zn-dependent hydrolase [Virgibacillus ihumii]